MFYKIRYSIKATIYLSGVVNETPVDFSVVVKFKVKMVASVI
jgi:hypothetical protein